MKQLTLTCLFTISLNLVFSQVINLSPRQDSTTSYEKLYLHTDRDIYSPGDDIWFKSYLVSGINNQYIPGFKNVYVQLIAENGNIIDNRLMLSVYGEANNDFHLPDTLHEGSYTIRAYTKYLQNFGEESLFHKKIKIAKASDTPALRIKDKDVNNIDISFLPEGGNLVLNAANRIAFKAIDKNGKGVNVSGKIVDESGQTVTTFTTTYKGMGSFVMMPVDGKAYYAKIDGYPDVMYKFENLISGGIAMHYETKGNSMVFKLSQDFKSTRTRKLILVVWHKDQEVYSEDVEMNGFQHAVEIYKGFFPEGISKITLYDEQQKVMAERLIFVRNENGETLEISTDKNEYGIREKGFIKISSVLNYNDTIENTLSIAIVNEDYCEAGGINQTIESYLLLDSELKGPLESPASYFMDEEEITAEEKLDLVMQVNGWRRYYWNELNKYDWHQLPHWDDTGLTVTGKVTTLFGENPVEKGIVKLGPFSSLFIILNDTTNKAGQYSFERLFLKDSALIMINATNEKGRNSVNITNETPPIFDSLISIIEINNTIYDNSIPEKFYETSFYRHVAEQEFKLEEGSILIKEVEVKEERKSPPNITGVYGFATRSYTITDENRENYSDIMKYIEFEISGIIDYGEGLRIGLGKSSPIFFVDGYQPAIDLELMSLDDIEKVEIISPSRLSSLMRVPAFGGPGGVISILTKSGYGNFNNEFVRNIHGRITPRVRGFRQAREFYSPTYQLAEQDSIIKPDQRPTLYWNPNVMLDNGEANLEFFTSDMEGKYRVIVEGISSRGRASVGTTLLNVGGSEK